MKNMISLLLLSTFSIALMAQSSPTLEINQLRTKKTKQAMTILGSWAVINIGSGLILQSQTEGIPKYFHQMNAGWNVVNLGLAALSLHKAKKTDLTGLSSFETIEAQHRLQKILLFNAGLDVGYMAMGAWLNERGQNIADLGKANQYQGWGQSLILQGGFLFVFDLTTFLALKADNPKLENLLGHLNVNGNGLTWSSTF